MLDLIGFVFVLIFGSVIVLWAITMIIGAILAILSYLFPCMKPIEGKCNRCCKQCLDNSRF